MVNRRKIVIPSRGVDNRTVTDKFGPKIPNYSIRWLEFLNPLPPFESSVTSDGGLSVFTDSRVVYIGL